MSRHTSKLGHLSHWSTVNHLAILMDGRTLHTNRRPIVVNLALVGILLMNQILAILLRLVS